jgi:hypothetical protein
VLAACSDEGPGEPETIEIPTRWASANARDLRTLVRTSDEVFLGRVTRLLGQSEADQPPGASGSRAPLPLTRFEITVTRALSGTLAAGDAVVIEQIGGTIEVSGGGRATMVLEDDEPLENGAQYLFFADYKPNGNLTAPPFGRLQAGQDGSLQPLAPWGDLGALRELTGLSASDAAARIKERR